LERNFKPDRTSKEMLITLLQTVEVNTHRPVAHNDYRKKKAEIVENRVR